MDGQKHIVRSASSGDEAAIMDFIRQYWSETHILACNPELFRYEFACRDRLNFVIALNRQSSLLEGVLGFIKYTEDYIDSDVFTVMWKVKEKNGEPALGLKLLSYLKKNYEFNTISGVGASKDTLSLYEYLGYKTGRLRHFYMLNPSVDAYHVAVIKDRKVAPRAEGGRRRGVHKIENFEQLVLSFDFSKQSEYRPYKDKYYVEKRYFRHPLYSYDIWGVSTGSVTEAIVIARRVAANGALALRIVDFIGDEKCLQEYGSHLPDILANGRFEYADFYSYGIDQNLISSCGFVLKDDDDPNIIPNYFEPFVQSNVDIHFFTSQFERFRIFKADGDQDRPSIF